MSSLDRNLDYVTSPYKINLSQISKGSWLAHFATFRYESIYDKPVIKYPENTVSDGGNSYPSPLIIRCDQKSILEDVRIAIEYEKASFSGWVDNIRYYTRTGTEKTEVVIPKDTAQNTLIDTHITDAVQINSIEIIEGLHYPLQFSILALASTNTRLFRMINFDDHLDRIYQMFFSRFVNRLPCWTCDGTGVYNGSTCPTCNGELKDQSFFTDQVAENVALDLNVFRSTLTETDLSLRRRTWGKRRWVIPRIPRNMDSNIHSLFAVYLDVDEENIFVYEKPTNFTSIDPDASVRPRTLFDDYFGEWAHTDTEALGTYLIHVERIQNKDFETRLTVSTIRGNDDDWVEFYIGNGRHDNTKRISDGYCFDLTAVAGYTGIYQKIDLSQITTLQFDYILDSEPYLPYMPPGVLKGRMQVYLSTAALAANPTIAEMQAMMDGGTLLHEDLIYYEDYLDSGIVRATVINPGLTGEYFLYFIVQSEANEVYLKVDTIRSDYGQASAISRVFDFERGVELQSFFWDIIINDGLFEWRYRTAGGIGQLYLADWSDWYTAEEFTPTEENVRFLQFQVRYTSTTIQDSSPIIMDEVDVVSSHEEHIGIILDPTVIVSMPIFDLGENYWWSYENLDQANFREMINSVVTGCVTPRTEFYFEEEDEL